jgi:hypothetical protein
MSEQPTPEALEWVEHFEVWLYAAMSTGEDEETAKMEIADWFDRFAANAVEAERTRIDKALAQKQQYFEAKGLEAKDDASIVNYEAKRSTVAYVRHEIVRAKQL